MRPKYPSPPPIFDNEILRERNADGTEKLGHGTAADGETRASIQVLCPSEVPCYDITIENYYIWTDTGSEILYKCENAYGSGPCLNDGTSYTTYTTTYTVTTTSAST